METDPEIFDSLKEYPLAGLELGMALVESPDARNLLASGVMSPSKIRQVGGPFMLEGKSYFLQSSGPVKVRGYGGAFGSENPEIELDESDSFQTYHFIPNLDVNPELSLWDRGMHFLYISSRRFTRSLMFLTDGREMRKEFRATVTAEEIKQTKSELLEYIHGVCRAPRPAHSAFSPTKVNGETTPMKKFLDNNIRKVLLGLGRDFKFTMPEFPEDLFVKEVAILTERIKKAASAKERSNLATRRLNLQVAKLGLLAAAKLCYNQSVLSEGAAFSVDEQVWYCNQVKNESLQLSSTLFLQLQEQRDEKYIKLRENDPYLSKDDVDSILFEAISEIFKAPVIEPVITYKNKKAGVVETKMYDKNPVPIFHMLITPNRLEKLGHAEAIIGALERILFRACVAMEKDYKGKADLCGAVRKLSIAGAEVISHSKRKSGYYRQAAGDYAAAKEHFTKLFEQGNYAEKSPLFHALVQIAIDYHHYSVKSKRPLVESVENMAKDLELLCRGNLGYWEASIATDSSCQKTK